MAVTDTTNWGYTAHADIAAFEEQLGSFQLAPSIVASSASQMASGNINQKHSSSTMAPTMSPANAARSSSARQPVVVSETGVGQQNQTAGLDLHQCQTAFSHQIGVDLDATAIPVFADLDAAAIPVFADLDATAIPIFAPLHAAAIPVFAPVQMVR